MDNKTTGFASPAQGYEEQRIDLNRLLILNPPATYIMRLESADMEKMCLAQGSLLIVDFSINPPNNSFVLLRHEGQLLCRLFVKEKGRVKFTNGESEIIPIPGETEIIGAVTASIKEYNHVSKISVSH